jgi:hypothetical protein
MPQRSPVIFWLLLAATLCVDAAIVTWMFAKGRVEESAPPFLAMSFAQLGILCVWVVFVPKQVRFSWIAPLVAGIVIAVIVAVSADVDSPGERWEGFIAFLVLTWTHVAIVLPILWLLKPTRIGVAYADPGTKPRWQFSVMHLLSAMTCIAVLSVLVRQSVWMRRQMDVLATLPMANVSLLLLVVVAVQIRRHWLLRLAASLAGALAVAAAVEWSQAEIANGLNFFVYTLIQAIVLWAWLEIMRQRSELDMAAGAGQSPATEG